MYFFLLFYHFVSNSNAHRLLLCFTSIDFVSNNLKGKKKTEITDCLCKIGTFDVRSPVFVFRLVNFLFKCGKEVLERVDRFTVNNFPPSNTFFHLAYPDCKQQRPLSLTRLHRCAG